MFGELRLVKALTDEQIETMRDPKRAPTAKLPRIEDAVKAGGFLTGTPSDVIEALKKLEERYPGLDRVTVSLSVGVPLSEALEQLEWFARDVMPAFKGVKVASRRWRSDRGRSAWRNGDGANARPIAQPI